jgi:hypothetical protein
MTAQEHGTNPLRGRGVSLEVVAFSVASVRA